MGARERRSVTARESVRGRDSMGSSEREGVW